MSKKKTILAASVATAGLAGILLVGGVAFAQTSSGKTSMAQAIATKFNLKTEDVQKVIDSQHEEMMKAHLDQLVKDGKITGDQENKIIAKQAEMRPKIEAAQAQTEPAERKKAMEAIKAEMQKWEKENNIPKGVMGPPRGGHGPGGPGGHGGMNGGAPPEGGVPTQ